MALKQRHKLDEMATNNIKMNKWNMAYSSKHEMTIFEIQTTLRTETTSRLRTAPQEGLIKQLTNAYRCTYP